jgi:hypothetical protein
MRTPLEVQYVNKDPNSEYKCITTYVFWLIDNLRTTHTQARLNIGRGVTRQKRYYDQDAKERNFYIGEWFYIKNFTKTKLELEWLGPYLVTGRPNQVTVAYTTTRGAPDTININNIKRCVDKGPRLFPAVLAATPDDPLPEFGRLFGEEFSQDSGAYPMEEPNQKTPLISVIETSKDTDEKASGETTTSGVVKMPPPPQRPPEQTATRTGRIIHKPPRYLD